MHHDTYHPTEIDVHKTKILPLPVDNVADSRACSARRARAPWCSVSDSGYVQQRYPKYRYIRMDHHGCGAGPAGAVGHLDVFRPLGMINSIMYIH